MALSNIFQAELCSFIKKLSENKFVTYSNFGAASIRDEKTGQIFITPAVTDKFNIRDWKYLRPEDVVVLDADGELVNTLTRQPSEEYQVHLAIYKERPEINAIAHVYSEHILAYSVTGKDLNPAMVEDVKTEIGGDDGVVRCVPLKPLRSDEYIRSILHGLRDKKKAVFSRYNGAFCMDNSASNAYCMAAVLERQTTMEIDAHVLGGVNYIDIEMMIDESIRPIRRRKND